MREAYLADTPAETGRIALAAADSMMARALDSGMPRLITNAAHKALGVSPLCADAYAALAEDARTPELALDFYKRAVHAAELALGPGAFDRWAGQFWTMPETQAYMRALRGLADVLLELEQEEAAIEHLETMLRLNPADHLGARYPLLAYYLDQFELQPAKDLLAAFADEDSTTWLYARVLLAYRDERQAGPETEALIEAALKANRHVPGILIGVEPDAFADDDDDVPRGSAEEATEYVIASEDAWKSTPGAVAWLVLRAAAAGIEFP